MVAVGFIHTANVKFWDEPVSPRALVVLIYPVPVVTALFSIPAL